jgi:Clostripain family
MNRNAVGFIIFIFVSLILSSCGSIGRSVNQIDYRLPVKYSLVFIIHGDGDYMYHDMNGKAHNADQEILGKIIDVAKNLQNSEVFIIHQKAESHFLFVPLDDGEYYYYRNGNLIEKDSYRIHRNRSAFEYESSIFQMVRAEAANNLSGTFFFYYGHQIPELDGHGYDESDPSSNFNIDSLAQGLKNFEKIYNMNKFSLVVLSTCNNGTPGVISKLAGNADFIIASPEKLYLSYINPNYLKTLDGKSNINLYDFSKSFAKSAFEKLQQQTETVVSISLYNTSKIKPFLKRISPEYFQSLAELNSKEDESLWAGCDCDSIKNAALPETGVDVFYRPPQFGRNQKIKSNSGWGCWKLQN